MPSPHALFRSPAALLLATLPCAAQGFVDQTIAIGVDHEVATGFDSVGGTSVRDFMQRGLALSDIDGDGDPDIVAVGGVLPNSVWRNDGGVFTDVTLSANIEAGELDTAPCLADTDGDGDVDLWIGVLDSGGSGGGATPRSRFYRNTGGGVFEDVSVLAGTAGFGHSSYGMWSDIDYDGLADLLVGEFYATDNPIYRNNGDGTFTDVSASTGIDTDGLTHVMCVFDSDRDGYFDVFVGNDYYVGISATLPNNTPDYHVASVVGGESWSDVSAGSGFNHERGIMGYALGDVNYDGLMDVYKTDVFANRLTINQGWPGGAVWLGEEQLAYGVEAAWVPDHSDPGEDGKAVGWGAVFMDFDYDPWLDLFVVNGQVAGTVPAGMFSPRDQHNFYFQGDGPGAGFTFTDRTVEVGLYEEIDDRCLVVADVDADGDVDLFIAPTVGKLRYFENVHDPAGQGWLMVKPVCNTSAPGGFGVEVSYTDTLGYPHIRQIGQDGPTAAQHDNFAYFGLGTEASVALTVTFPSGIQLDLPGTTPNQVLHPVEPKLVETNARTMPITANPRLAGTLSKPGGGGAPLALYAVTAYAHAQDGTPLDATAAVTIETPGLVAASGVLSLGGNMFRRYFYAPPAPGAYRSEVTFDGWACKIRPRIHFFDPGDVTGTAVSIQPEAVRAGSADTFTVTVAPKDAEGISLGTGDSVSIDFIGILPLGPVEDLGDGRYRAEFGAPAFTGNYPVLVSVNGTAVTTSASLDVGGAAVNSVSDLEVEVPYENISAAPHQLKLKITPRDIDANRIGPAPVLSVIPVATGGTQPVVWRSDVPGGQADGDYYVIIEKPLTDPPTYVEGVLQILYDGVGQTNLPYSF